MSEAKVVSLVPRNVEDIPSMLEQLAKELRAGEQGDIVAGAGVFLNASGEPVVCGWGKDTDAIRSIGLLHLGAAWLASNQVER